MPLLNKSNCKTSALFYSKISSHFLALLVILVLRPNCKISDCWLTIKCCPTMSCPTLAGIEILTSYLMQIRSKLLWIKRWYTSQIEIYWLTLELFLGASGKDRLSSALATSPPEPSNMHVGKSRKDFNVTFFFSAFFFLLPSSSHAIDTGILNIQDSGRTRDQNPALTTPVWHVHICFARSRFFSLPAFRLWTYSTSLQESQEKEVGWH